MLPETAATSIPTGSFEVQPDGTILDFRPYCDSDNSQDAALLRGKNLFSDVVRSVSERDARVFAELLESGRGYRASRHLLNGRDLSLVLLYHGDTDTFWAFLGPT